MNVKVATFNHILRGNVLHVLFNQNADNSSSLGRLKDHLFLYYSNQTALAIQETLRGKHAGISFQLLILSVFHFLFSTVSLSHIHTQKSNK